MVGQFSSVTVITHAAVEPVTTVQRTQGRAGQLSSHGEGIQRTHGRSRCVWQADVTVQSRPHKSTKWYRCIFFWALNVAIINGWLLYHWHCQQLQQPCRIHYSASSCGVHSSRQWGSYPSEQTVPNGCAQEGSSIVVINKSGTCFWRGTATWIQEKTGFCSCTICPFWQHWSPSTVNLSSAVQSARVMFARSAWNVLCIPALQNKRTAIYYLGLSLSILTLHLSSIC